jgi:hypothetical protein
MHYGVARALTVAATIVAIFPKKIILGKKSS